MNDKPVPSLLWKMLYEPLKYSISFSLLILIVGILAFFGTIYSVDKNYKAMKFILSFVESNYIMSYAKRRVKWN